MNTKENTVKNSLKSKLMKTLLGIAVATLIPSGAAMAAPLVIVQEDFENDTVGLPPANAEIGTWQPGTGLYVYTPAGQTKAANEWHGGTTNGYLKSSLQVTGPLNPIHFEFDLHYLEGYAAFGITSDATANTRAGQEANSVVFLNFQDAQGNYTLGVNALLAGGSASTYNAANYLNLASQTAFHNPENPFTGGQYYDHVEFDYVTGDSTGTLRINGNVISSSVPLHNPSGAVDGVFFISTPPSIEDYVIDNVLLTVPEPTTVTLTSLAIAGLIVAQRRRV